MRANTISLSEKAFLAVLTLMECGGRYGLPKGFGQGNEEMQKFLEGRDELCRKGFAELDFDGSINPTRAFIRTLYTLPRATSSMCFERDADKAWFLRGPIELLQIYREGGNYICRQCGTDELIAWVRDVLYEAAEGRIVTASRGRRREAAFSSATRKREERANVLAEHLCMFFEKEAADA